MEAAEETTTTKSLYGFDVRVEDGRRVENRKQDIQQLWQKQHEIILLHLRGYKNVQIAEILNVTPQTVSNAVNSTLGKEKISTLREQRDEDAIKFDQKVSSLTEKALRAYEDILDDPAAGHEIKRKVSDTVVLEIAGHRAPTKIQATNVNTTASLEQIEAMKQRGLAAAKECGMIIDITPKQIEEDTDE